MLQAKNVTLKKNNKTILQSVNFRLEQKECVGLVGANGSGKSSLLKILSLLESPTSGELLYRGIPVPSKIPLDIRRNMGVVFQEPLLLNTSVFENVAVGLKSRKITRPEIKQRIEKWLTRFDILHLMKRHVRSLSGGEAQRVSLARAFALEPEILFLDEPFSALDVLTKESLLKDLFDVFQKTKIASVIVSHDFHDIECLTTRTVVLFNGKVVTDDKTSNILRSRISNVEESFSAFLANLSIAKDNFGH